MAVPRPAPVRRTLVLSLSSRMTRVNFSALSSISFSRMMENQYFVGPSHPWPVMSVPRLHP